MQATSTRNGSCSTAATSATTVGRQARTWRRRVRMTGAMASAVIGARTAARSHRGDGAARRRGLAALAFTADHRKKPLRERLVADGPARHEGGLALVDHLPQLAARVGVATLLDE